MAWGHRLTIYSPITWPIWIQLINNIILYIEGWEQKGSKSIQVKKHLRLISLSPLDILYSSYCIQYNNIVRLLYKPKNDTSIVLWEKVTSPKPINKPVYTIFSLCFGTLCFGTPCKIFKIVIFCISKFWDTFKIVIFFDSIFWDTYISNLSSQLKSIMCITNARQIYNDCNKIRDKYGT